MRSTFGDARMATGEERVVLVTLYAPAFVVRGATEAVNIFDSELNTDLFYDARVTSSLTVEREVDAFALERSSISTARVEIVLPENLSGAGLEADYHYLTASRCEVAMIWPGQKWAQREVIIGRGTVSGLKLGIGEEPTSFVVEALPPRAGAAIGDASRDMFRTGGYVPIGGSGLAGKQFPTIIGRCYRLPCFKHTGYERLILAGHHFATPTVTTIYEGEDAIGGTSYTATGTVTFYNTTDGAGDPVAYMQSSNAADFTAAQDKFTFDASNGGVFGVDGSNGPALGADQVVAYILAQSGELIDFDAMRRTYQLLQGLDIGVYVDKATDALKLLRDRVLPFLPLIEETGQNGLWLRYTDITTQSAEVDLIEGVNLVGRTTGLEQVSDPDEAYNSFTVNYFYDHALGRYTKSYTVDASNHPLCALSAQLFGTRVAPTLNCNIAWSDRTAAFIANSRANRLALPRMGCGWIADPSLYWLREGTVVNLTSPTLGLSGRKSVVRSALLVGGAPRLSIEIAPGVLTTKLL